MPTYRRWGDVVYCLCRHSVSTPCPSPVSGKCSFVGKPMSAFAWSSREVGEQFDFWWPALRWSRALWVRLLCNSHPTWFSVVPEFVAIVYGRFWSLDAMPGPFSVSLVTFQSWNCIGHDFSLCVMLQRLVTWSFGHSGTFGWRLQRVVQWQPGNIDETVALARGVVLHSITTLPSFWCHFCGASNIHSRFATLWSYWRIDGAPLFHIVYRHFGLQIDALG